VTQGEKVQRGFVMIGELLQRLASRCRSRHRPAGTRRCGA
jgi:hypothetical protein